MSQEFVQLTHLEIALTRLTAPGQSLDRLLLPYGSPAVDMFEDETIPNDDWRVIDGDPDGEGTVVAAAPADDGFVLLYLNREDGDWSAVADPQPQPVAPCKAIRASALQLTLADSIQWSRGTTPQLAAQLRNDGDRPFPDDRFGYDSLHAIGWLKEANPTGWFAYTSSDGQGICSPGATVSVPVQLTTAQIETLPPGDYRFQAMLTSVDLYSNVVSLTIV